MDDGIFNDIIFRDSCVAQTEVQARYRNLGGRDREAEKGEGLVIIGLEPFP